MELLNQMDGFDQTANVKVRTLVVVVVVVFTLRPGDHGHKSARHSRSCPSPTWSFGP